jgi:murein DD-endopeptidase MepM/ murein hydrolase activator NlpD
LRQETETYIVRPGDTLYDIARRFTVGVGQIEEANGLSNVAYLYAYSVLTIPPPVPEGPGPDLKLIPDAALVYGPYALQPGAVAVIARGSTLELVRQEVQGRVMDGVEIVNHVARSYSVDPRLLLALLEYQGEWLSRRDPTAAQAPYPLGWVEAGREGLADQLSWAASQLNWGFYRWQAGWSGPYVFFDGRVVIPAGGLNAGTVAVQHLFSQLYPVETWRNVVGPDGFMRTYRSLFGDPFALAVEPLVPPDLTQPPLQLPFEPGRIWSFTGGPHGAWGNSSAWAALDFAPPGAVAGCVISNEWVTAAADGLVVRSQDGQVLLDLDGDGNEGTGWVLLYLHIESRDRVPLGTWLKAGQRIGHPSCEGGVASGTHLHLARKYNGVWIAADGDLPFNLEGWVSAGLGRPYQGTLQRGDETLYSCACRAAYNQIGRE